MLLKVNDISHSSIIPNWLGKLMLFFSIYHGKSVLTKCWHNGPFYVQKPFYHEYDVPHVYLLHPPGGLVGGDQLNLVVNLGIGSHVLLTTPGSTKFYRSIQSYVYLRQEFYVNKDSTLEWLPQSNIFFPQSKVIIDTEFVIEEGARCIFFETLCFGYYGSFNKIFRKGILNFFLSVILKNSIGLKERVKIDYSDEPNFSQFGGFRINAVFFAMPSNTKILIDVRVLIIQYDVKVWGATLLDNCLIVRLLDNDNERIQMLLRALWYFLRPVIIKRTPVIPRIWFT